MSERFSLLFVGLVLFTGVALLLLAVYTLPPATLPGFLSGAAVVLLITLVLALVAARVLAWKFHQTIAGFSATVQSDPTTAPADALLHADVPDDLVPLVRALRQRDAHARAIADALQREGDQMMAVFSHMADGLLVLDEDERIELANPAAERLLRLHTLLHRHLAEAVRHPGLVEVARSAGSSRPVSQVLELQPRPSLPRRWVQVVATRLPGHQSTVLLLHDVTDLRRVEAARRDFVANVSHELRTPIAALKALVETLEDGAIDDPVAGPDFLRRMHVEVDGLAHLVSELLELARVESGRLDLELVPCSARNMVVESVERMRPYAERLSLTVAVDESGDDALVQADRRRMAQVLANLLANAVKFTPPGGTMTAGITPSAQSVEFWVSDTGIGIHPENLVRVFERFYKADPSRTGSGTGLGLAICKHVVQAHGGSVWAESGGEGRGATFHFTLRRAEERAAASDQPPGSEPRGNAGDSEHSPTRRRGSAARSRHFTPVPPRTDNLPEPTPSVPS